MTEEVINAIIAGIGSSEDATEQAIEIIANLNRAGYVIAHNSQVKADPFREPTP